LHVVGSLLPVLHSLCEQVPPPDELELEVEVLLVEELELEEPPEQDLPQ
jgi:hypothetical protein